jgi:hypothetical protein
LTMQIQQKNGEIDKLEVIENGADKWLALMAKHCGIVPFKNNPSIFPDLGELI